jgi:excisionase family DNA binding protein
MQMYAAPSISNEKLGYSVKEAARVLGVSPRTISNYLAQGSLRSVKICGRRFIRRKDLIQFLDCAMAA